MSIKKDLALGKEAEHYLTDMLDDNSISYEKVSHVNRSLYDINTEYGTIEVKYDMFAKKSGNIAIEIFNPLTGKHSGVGITEATYWCHIVGDPNNIYITKVELLKKYIDEHTPLRVVHEAGDGNATICLYKKEKILEIFQKIDSKNLKQVLEGYNNGSV
jgi:hypothetical protein